METARNLYKSITKVFKNVKSITIDFAYHYVYYIDEDIIQKIEYTVIDIYLKKGKDIIFFYMLYINSKTTVKLFKKEKQIYTYVSNLLYINFQNSIFIKKYKHK